MDDRHIRKARRLKTRLPQDYAGFRTALVLNR